MSRFGTIDLSRLPPPDVVERLDFETILGAMKAALLARAPDLAPVLALESEPAVKILEVCAYRELLLRARINDAARAVMLATATGADLDHLAALFGVGRFVLDPGDPDAAPPVPPTYESDGDLRYRAQLAIEGFSVAGPVGAYTYHAFAASPLVRDVAVSSPTPGTVQVTILSGEEPGTASPALILNVEAALSADDVRPLCDSVVVQSATILPYAIAAELETDQGPDSALIAEDAFAAVALYAEQTHRLGRPVTRGGIYAALYRPGVRRVTLTLPAADVEAGPTEAPRCTGIEVTLAEEEE